MNLDLTLRTEIQKATAVLFNTSIPPQLQPTNQEFEGSHTVVCFPYIKFSNESPDETARKIGEYLYLTNHPHLISTFKVVKGFLNLTISDQAWIDVFKSIYSNPLFGESSANGKEIIVEYSSPNTNKPLHLGHLRNNFLGWSVAEIYKAIGYNVHKVQIINDRGIHICKSMAAWKLFGQGETPLSSNLKGDKLVGNYYVKFNEELKRQVQDISNRLYNQAYLDFFDENERNELSKNFSAIQSLRLDQKILVERTDFSLLVSFGEFFEIKLESAIDENIRWKQLLRLVESEVESIDNISINESDRNEVIRLLKPIISIEDKIYDKISKIEDIVELKTPIMLSAQDLLRKWESGDAETLDLWRVMNDWVYDGFKVTYKRMGVDFEKLYFESNTYLLGKDEVLRGVETGVFFRKPDGSVWIDLSSNKLGEKLLLRSDGTSVYMTQDIGTAILRFRDFPRIEKQIYTVGNEQEHHFKVLFLVLGKLGYEWAKECYHLSYGMVDLPTGKMKSREGTVVDADDLMSVMVQEAEKKTLEGGHMGQSYDEDKKLYEMIGIGALKFFLLKVDPKKRMLFDPAESIELQGHTGPFIQYTYARIRSIIRRADSLDITKDIENISFLESNERETIFKIYQYNQKLAEAAKEYSPAVIANYAFELAKSYNQFYQAIPIFSEVDASKLKFRVAFSQVVADVLKKAMGLLGIEVPERM